MQSSTENTTRRSEELSIATEMLAKYEEELHRTSVAYTPSMPSQIAAHYRERRSYCHQGAVDVLRKIVAEETPNN